MMLEWILYERIISNGLPVEKELFLKSSQDDFEKLTSIDVLGLSEPPELNSYFNAFVRNLH